MGLNSRTLRLLSQLKQRGALSARSVVDIGAQQLHDSCLADEQGLTEIAAAFGVPTPQLPRPVAPADGLLRGDAPPARLLYEALGAKYTAIDIDGTPDAICLDLNYDSAPRSLQAKFDLTTNFGTTEHVANQMNAFAIVHDLTQLDGVMIHELPSQGQLNHGLISYNPKFFWMLARSNNYEWLHFDFSWDDRSGTLPDNVEHEIRKYSSLDGRGPFALLDCTLIVALRKTSRRRFIPPVDVNTGTLATTKRLYQRYPTVFSGISPPSAMPRKQPHA